MPAISFHGTQECFSRISSGNCFTVPNDFKLPQDCTRSLIIRLECIQAHSCNEAFNTLYCRQNILQVNGVISHMATTSVKTDSRSSSRRTCFGTISTGRWNISSKYNARPIQSNRSVSPSNSARRSMSLLESCSPRTKEPNKLISLTLYRVVRKGFNSLNFAKTSSAFITAFLAILP
jgi:hypothetical protein